VLFFTDMALVFASGESGDGAVEIGSAAVRRPGRDVGLIAYAKSVPACLQAAEALAERGIEAEVVDLRTLKPLDETTVLASVRRTGRAVVVHEASRTCGVGAEVAATIAEKAFGKLVAPVLRVTGPDAPVAASSPLEQAFAPQPERIAAAAEGLVRSGTSAGTPAVTAA